MADELDKLEKRFQNVFEKLRITLDDLQKKRLELDNQKQDKNLFPELPSSMYYYQESPQIISFIIRETQNSSNLQSQQVSQPTIELKQTNQKSQFKPSIDYIDERDLDMNENEIHFENEKIPLLSSDDLTNFAQLWLHPTDDINTKLKKIGSWDYIPSFYNVAPIQGIPMELVHSWVFRNIMYIKPPEKSREIISKLYSNPTPTVDSFVSFIKPYCGKASREWALKLWKFLVSSQIRSSNDQYWQISLSKFGKVINTEGKTKNTIFEMNKEELKSVNFDERRNQYLKEIGICSQLRYLNDLKNVDIENIYTYEEKLQKLNEIKAEKKKEQESEFELRAKERDYKRRRASYRGKKDPKKTKKSTTLTFRGLIESYMNELKEKESVR